MIYDTSKNDKIKILEKSFIKSNKKRIRLIMNNKIYEINKSIIKTNKKNELNIKIKLLEDLQDIKMMFNQFHH